MYAVVQPIHINHFNGELTLCPNNMVLAVSALCLGDGPTVITNEVLDVPAKSQEVNQHDWNFIKN